MNQIFHHHNKWEDWQAGLLDTKCDNQHKLMVLSMILLSHPRTLYWAMRDMLDVWPISCEVNLTAPGNRRAWMGQSACCLAHNAPAFVTKSAWGRITERARKRANRVADKVILYWEKNYAKDTIGGGRTHHRTAADKLDV